MQHRLLISGLIALALGVSGCSHLGGFKDIAPNITIHKPVPVSPPKPYPMTLNDVQWQVYDLAGLKALVTKLEASGQKDAVVYVLDQSNFQVLANNLAEMKRFIADQKDENDFLVKAIEINGQQVTPVTTSPKK